MEKRILIRTKSVGQVEAIISSENPQTATAIWDSLPFTEKANRWGDEIYFAIPVKMKEEKSRAEVELGSVAYWPPGHALCIFFGATPASRRNEPRAASPVNVFAKVIGDSTVLRKVQDGEDVTISRSEHRS